jgi:hypothetical protein
MASRLLPAVNGNLSQTIVPRIADLRARRRSGGRNGRSNQANTSCPDIAPTLPRSAVVE